MSAICGYRGCNRTPEPGFDGLCPTCWANDIGWYTLNRWWYDPIDSLHCRLMRLGIRLPLGRLLDWARYESRTRP